MIVILLFVYAAGMLISWRLLSGRVNDIGRASLLLFLCESRRQNFPVRDMDLGFVWSLVREALMSSLIAYTVSYSSPGFLTIPLSSLIKDGNIDECFHLHVWQPDGNRGIPNAIGCHVTQTQLELPQYYN